MVTGHAMTSSTDTSEKAATAGRALLEKKARDLQILDLSTVSQFTDVFIIATGTSSPHLKALATDVSHALRSCGVAHPRQMGMAASGWIIVDGGDVVIHILTDEARRRYAIEDLWQDAPRLPLP